VGSNVNRRPYLELVRLLDEGKTRDEIAEHFGIRRALVNDWIHAARDKGYLAPFKSKIDQSLIDFAKMEQEGVSREEMSEHFGVTLNTLVNWGVKARGMGLLPPATGIRPYRRVPFGSIAQIIQSLDPKVRDWLTKQVPVDSNYAETLVAIINDAYHEEHHV